MPAGGGQGRLPLYAPCIHLRPPRQVLWLWTHKQNPVQLSERTTGRRPANPWPGQVEVGHSPTGVSVGAGLGSLLGLLAQPRALEAAGTLTSRAAT